MNSIEATIRNTKSKGEVNALRTKGMVPGIVYGGKDQNQKISISKKIFKSLVEKENFLSNILTLNIEGKTDISKLVKDYFKENGYHFEEEDDDDW